LDNLNARIDGSFVLDRDLCFHGLVTGSITVPRGRRLELYGTIGYDLIVEAGASALVVGTICGTLVNLGGDVDMKGHAANISDQRPRDIAAS
jgi:hypothetical protein